MHPFTLERPASVDDATRLAAGGGQFLAGGQTLLASMKLRLAQPEQLVDLSRIDGLAGIRRDGDAIVVGAMTRHMAVAGSDEIRSAIPALAEMASHIGDRQVRTMGTLGGSLANNDPAACYPAAVLGLGATVVTNRREIAADDFFVGLYTTALDEGELVVAVRFPVPKSAAYMKFEQPASKFALVGVFVAATAGGVRVAVTGGGNGVYREKATESALSSSMTPEALASVRVDASALNGDLHASAAYRAHLIGVMARRAVERIVAG